MKKITEILALVIGSSAILTIVFYLITGFSKPLIPYEPIWWIRIPEIIMGIFASYILIKMIFKRK